jgi:hypothetical protein
MHARHGAQLSQVVGKLRGIDYEGCTLFFEPIFAVFETASEGFAEDSSWTGYNMPLDHAESG